MTQNYLSNSYGYAEFMNQPQYQNEKPSAQVRTLLFTRMTTFLKETIENHYLFLYMHNIFLGTFTQTYLCQ